MDMRFISGYNVYTSTLFTNVSTNPQPEFLETTSDLFTLHQRHIINVWANKDINIMNVSNSGLEKHASSNFSTH